MKTNLITILLLLLATQIAVAQKPPCSSLSTILFTQDFGTGTFLTGTIPSPSTPSGVIGVYHNSTYAPTATAPLALNSYTLSNNANNANPANYINLEDHTGNANGRMLIISSDADVNRMYLAGLTIPLCPNQRYSVSFYAAYPANAAYEAGCNSAGGLAHPNMLVRVRDGLFGTLIAELPTDSITNPEWQQYGLSFVTTEAYSSIIFEIINIGATGCGNDILIDDIQFGACDALPQVAINSVAGCLAGTTTFSGFLAEPDVIPGAKEYQWQVSPAYAGPYSDIAGATSASYSIPSVQASDTGKYYRLAVAAQGNIGSVNCVVNSQGTYLAGRTSSVAATSVKKDKNNICAGLPVTLGITGGSLGTNAAWRWYQGSCAGTFVGSGSSQLVMPTTTTNYYLKAVGDCNTTVCRAVTIFITCDIDKDKDGIPDYVESYMPAALLDHNSNGITNAFDPLYPGYVDFNNDQINDNFQADGDSNNDGIANYLDTSFPGRIDINSDGIDDRFDADQDGIINMLDLDSDNDGIPDVVEAGGVDENGDARLDNFADTDNDGLSQNVDANNTGSRISGTGLSATDLDKDGIPNAIDIDSDGDGIPDLAEAGGQDADNNGRVDGFTDVNGDGLSDTDINASALLHTGADTNNDGRADSYPFKNFDNDKRPDCYDIDSDMDGIPDVVEAGYPDADYNGFIDGPISADGWNTTIRNLSSLNLRNTDGDTNPNYLDIDSDNDGITDNIEGQTTAGYKLPTYLDNDNDGLDNAYDPAPFAAAFGGEGIMPLDTDQDGIPDCLDTDSDADGQPDVLEGNDFNGNGAADDEVSLTHLDDDADGLDNRFDSLNSFTNKKGTSATMGNAGSMTGDPSPGTRSPLQKTVATQPQRDWRYVSYVLPVQLFTLTGSLEKNISMLHWQIATTVMPAKFEIERSTDNISFKKIATLPGPIAANEMMHYDDDVTTLAPAVIFYRIRAIAANGPEKLSPVLMLKKANAGQLFSIYPNPAAGTVTLGFSATKEALVSFVLKDAAGRQLCEKQYKVIKGINRLSFTPDAGLAVAVYWLQGIVDGQLLTGKLIILH